jgi:ABC-type ATPase with predicted acetyltransferase domain
VPLSRNARRIVELFDLLPSDLAAPARLSVPPGLRLPNPGNILLVTGPSGAGKSMLLRRLAAGAPRNVAVIDVNAIALAPVACVDQFGPRLADALDLLNRVGLGEACTYLRRPVELSDGQRWRLRLAVAIHRATAMRLAGGRNGGREAIVLVADEFCAVLDRVSAAVVARSLRRTIDRLHRAGLPIAALLATSHEDLRRALRPDQAAHCDFASPTGTAR